jgi:hypothetical protein
MRSRACVKAASNWHLALATVVAAGFSGFEPKMQRAVDRLDVCVNDRGRRIRCHGATLVRLSDGLGGDRF